MASILIVSKPLEAPWNDSGKNVPRDLVAYLPPRHHLRVLTAGGRPPREDDHVIAEPIYRQGGRFSPSKFANIRVLARLLRRDGVELVHFFFAPNPLTSSAMRWALRLRRRKASVQTVLSVPRAFDAPDTKPESIRRLFSTDRVVTLSAHSAARLDALGVPGVVHIPPGVPIPDAVPTAEARRAARAQFDLPEDARVVVFPGDYQFSNAAALVADAIPQILKAAPDAFFVFACRIKQPESVALEAQIKAQLEPLRGRIQFLRQVDDMAALLTASDVVTLPQSETYAKADLPLVLLEAMALERPVVVVDAAPIREVVAQGGGVAVAPTAPALAEALTGLLLDDDRRRSLARSAREVAESHFSAVVMASRYQDLYDSLL